MRSKLIRAVMLLFFPVAAAFFAPPASAFLIDFQHQTVYEFVNDFTGHYFLADAADTTFLNRGGAGAGWRMTGHLFQVYNAGLGTGACRFYAPGTNKHFFTAST